METHRRPERVASQSGGVVGLGVTANPSTDNYFLADPQRILTKHS